MGSGKAPEGYKVRGGQRFPTRSPGTVVYDRKPADITIVDISRVGARITGDDLPAIGDEVVLVTSGLEVVATVVWNDGSSCGLNFHRPIDPLLVVHHHRRVSDRNALRRANGMRYASGMPTS